MQGTLEIGETGSLEDSTLGAAWATEQAPVSPQNAIDESQIYSSMHPKIGCIHG